jgi:hypothetical protein
MAAEIKKIVLDADGRYVQHRLPDSHEPPLKIVSRGHDCVLRNCRMLRRGHW